MHRMANGRLVFAVVKILNFMARGTDGLTVAAKGFVGLCQTLTPTTVARGFVSRESGCTNRSAPNFADSHFANPTLQNANQLNRHVTNLNMPRRRGSICSARHIGPRVSPFPAPRAGAGNGETL